MGQSNNNKGNNKPPVNCPMMNKKKETT